jgi:hypothetical protein
VDGHLLLVSHYQIEIGAGVMNLYCYAVGVMIFVTPITSMAIDRVVKEWECKDRWSSWDDIRINAVVLDEADEWNAKITIGEIKEIAMFENNGLYRKWSYGVGKGLRFKYALTIEKGIGSYYEFESTGKSGKVDPSRFFMCRQIGAESMWPD